MSEELTLSRPTEAGTLALAQMPEEEFEQRLATLKLGRARISRIKKELMTEEMHYGTIPGTPKPTLYKPGAEVLCDVFGLRPDFKEAIEYGDNETSPAVRVVMRCELHLGNLDGPVVAVGVGSANSWERGHRYRRGERACPKCAVIGSIIKGREEYGCGWLCWKKRGGCGAKFKIDDPEITQQAIGDVDNPDPHDLENTLLKMAKKRAHVDAALTGTASSGLFTQDAEDLAAPEEPRQEALRQEQRKAQKPEPQKQPQTSEPLRCRAPNEAEFSSPAALAAECKRLVGGGVGKARELFAELTGRDTAKSMNGSKAQEGWFKLENHPQYGRPQEEKEIPDDGIF